jgi:hypothetical protein
MENSKDRLESFIRALSISTAAFTASIISVGDTSGGSACATGRAVALWTGLATSAMRGAPSAFTLSSAAMIAVS